MVKGIEKFKVGDRVSTKDLLDTCGVYFLLSNTTMDDQNTFTIGTIEFIGTEKNEEMQSVYNDCIKRFKKKPLMFINTYTGGNDTWEHF